jgi:hypothetical protein
LYISYRSAQARSRPDSPAIADLDDDGNADLVVTSFQTAALSFLLGTRTGTRPSHG